MPEQKSDSEKAIGVDQVHSHDESPKGTVGPLKRNLQGRHIQMIAIGTYWL
jgi:amino acid permease